MVWKKLFASLGVGGASVDTVLHEPNVVPGGVIHGEVHIEGGAVAQTVQGLSVGFQARVEYETEHGEGKRDIEFARQPLGGELRLSEGVGHVVPFALEVPWETPVTMFLGQRLPGMEIGVSTELALAKAVDSTDLDPVFVHPLPAQQAILDAFESLGFRFSSADLEQGFIHGTRQRLPFYQEVEFLAPRQYRGLREVEVSFIADEREMDVVLEMDKKPGPLSEGSDSYHAFRVALADHGATDWAGYLNRWISEVSGRRNWL